MLAIHLFAGSAIKVWVEFGWIGQLSNVYGDGVSERSLNLLERRSRVLDGVVQPSCANLSFRHVVAQRNHSGHSHRVEDVRRFRPLAKLAGVGVGGKCGGFNDSGAVIVHFFTISKYSSTI